MTKEDEDNLLRWLQDKDISEVMDLLMRHGNRYSRRILKFFRWFCKYVPITIMLFHAYSMWNFSQHPRDMFIPYAENTPCYLYIYFMVYVLQSTDKRKCDRVIFALPYSSYLCIRNVTIVLVNIKDNLKRLYHGNDRCKSSREENLRRGKEAR